MVNEMEWCEEQWCVEEDWSCSEGVKERRNGQMEVLVRQREEGAVVFERWRGAFVG